MSLYENNKHIFELMYTQDKPYLRIGDIWFGYDVENKTEDRDSTVVGVYNFSNKQIISLSAIRTEAAMTFSSIDSAVDNVQIELIINNRNYEKLKKLYAYSLIMPAVPVHNILISATLQPYMLNREIYIEYGYTVKLDFNMDDIDEKNKFTSQLMEAYASVPTYCTMSIQESSIPNHPDERRVILNLMRVLTGNSLSKKNKFIKYDSGARAQHNFIENIHLFKNDNSFVKTMNRCLGILTTDVDAYLKRVYKSKTEFTEIEDSDYDEKIEVVFTTPSNPKDSQLLDRILSEIDKAKEKIWISAYSLNEEKLINKLLEKSSVNIDIRILFCDTSLLEKQTETDDDVAIKEEINKLAQNDNITVTFVNRAHINSIMHNKIIVIDDKVTITGSTNLTRSGIFDQTNDTLIINSRSINSIYSNEFNMLNNYISRGTSHYSRNIPSAGTQLDISIFFTPDDRAETQILDLIERAKKRILFMVYSFTSNTLAGAIKVANNRKVDVRGIFCKTWADDNETYSVHSKIAPVKFKLGYSESKEKYNLIHNKIMIVDDYLITGSYNFTASARTNNDENILIIKNKELVEEYINYFEKNWKRI